DNLNWDIYSENTNSGIPILINRSLSETDADSTNKLNEFVATGSKLRSNPIQIIDLRWNIGGNDGYAKQWVQNYTGISPANPFFWTTLLSDTALDINNNGGGNSPMPGTQWANILSPTQKPIPNNNLLIVLTDGQCCSAGESFVGYLRQIDNVIFVGVPTMGCLLCGNVGSTILPESKLSIRFGVNLSVLPDLSVFEGNGFAPDLWVPPGESLDHVIKFIEQYGYN
ncbi:MAG: S41 family peptidase, partial [Oscillospiraceae bacterium]|nr:S41 family peptidase [Oscillospiraceae bacterium]